MSSQPLDHSDLQQFIDAHRIEATILPLNTHTSTVPEAARALKVATEQIIKSLVFRLNDEPLLVINNGVARVDRRKLAAYLKVGRKRVKFATPEQALEITGYVVGSMPPFGHREKLRTIIDASILSLEMIFGGGGSLDTMMRLTPAELIRVTGGKIESVSE